MKFYGRKDIKGHWVAVVKLYLLIIIFLMIYLFSRQREREHKKGRAEREREGDTESKAGCRLQPIHTEPDTGLEPTNHAIMT